MPSPTATGGLHPPTDEASVEFHPDPFAAHLGTGAVPLTVYCCLLGGFRDEPAKYHPHHLQQ